MSKYVDGFVLAVPKKNLTKYKKMAKDACKIWIKHGALDYKECVIEDPAPECISFTFHKMAKAKEGDTVVFAYITYKSRAHRDRVNKKVMAEMTEAGCEDKDMPFDMKRFAWAGFEVLVDGVK